MSRVEGGETPTPISRGQLYRNYGAANATSRQSREDMKHESQMGFNSHQFETVELPFTPEQRYHQFRLMMWNYSTGFISHDDYKRAARPKKCLAGFFLCYAGTVAALRFQ